MAAAVAAPRYSAEDFETTSIHSVAPSYISEAPSYHSNPPYSEPAPPYAPRESRNTNNYTRRDLPNTSSQQQTIGLPPVPPAPLISVPNLHNFRIPTWSTRNAPAARQLHSVVERRMNSGMGSSLGSHSSASSSANPVASNRYHSSLDTTTSHVEEHVMRPLEDPYLVGERAAEQAKRERLARERGDDILLREDKQWDWLLEQMKNWDERERSFNKFRRQVDTSRRGKFLRRMGGRI